MIAHALSIFICGAIAFGLWKFLSWQGRKHKEQQSKLNQEERYQEWEDNISW